MLKAELHIHTREDPEDTIDYSAKEIINKCSKLGYQVLSITLHNKVFFSRDLESYAKKRGILLIPGVEVDIEGKHILILNAKSGDPKKLNIFNDLKKIKDHAIIVAPHPYYFRSDCLGKELDRHIDLFDAIEHHSLYIWTINRNKKAARMAKKYGKTLVGMSDLHWKEYLGHTYSLIDAKPTRKSVLEAIKNGKVKVVSKPLPFWLFSKMALRIVWNTFSGNYMRKKARIARMHI